MKQVDQKGCFWLDAHDEGGGVPTFEELDLIKDHSIKNHTIIVDDIPLYFADKKKSDKYFDLVLEKKEEFVIDAFFDLEDISVNKIDIKGGIFETTNPEYTTGKYEETEIALSFAF